jgi:hypothetical protein
MHTLQLAGVLVVWWGVIWENVYPDVLLRHTADKRCEKHRCSPQGLPGVEPGTIGLRLPWGHTSHLEVTLHGFIWYTWH